MNPQHKLVVAVTGASGALYAKVLFDKLQTLQGQLADAGVVFSPHTKHVWEHELGNREYLNIPFKVYAPMDFTAPFASGSARYNAMIVCPCSMGTLARIATGVSGDLTARAADVILKERRRLILVTRDTPLNLIQLNNMRTVTEAGGIVCPASPSFYSRPDTFEKLAATVIDRVLELAGFEVKTYRWNDK